MKAGSNTKYKTEHAPWGTVIMDIHPYTFIRIYKLCSTQWNIRYATDYGWLRCVRVIMNKITIPMGENGGNCMLRDRMYIEISVHSSKRLKSLKYKLLFIPLCSCEDICIMSSVTMVGGEGGGAGWEAVKMYHKLVLYICSLLQPLVTNPRNSSSLHTEKKTKNPSLCTLTIPLKWSTPTPAHSN